MQFRHAVFNLFASSLMLLPPGCLHGQAGAGELKLLHKLDSISASSSVSAYFADLYFVTMVDAMLFFDSAAPGSRDLIRQMQAGFAQSFFAAADSFAQQKLIPAAWKSYYADTSHTALRHVLLGITAHINGDIWPVLAGSFNYRQLKQLKSLYFSYYHGLLSIYDDVYRAVYTHSNKLRWLHRFSAGLDKWYGKKMLHRWLSRQMQLACAYHQHPEKHTRKLKRLRRKMDRLDRMVMRHL